MKIELNEDQQEEVVFAALLSLEEHFPEDKNYLRQLNEFFLILCPQEIGK